MYGATQKTGPGPADSRLPETAACWTLVGSACLFGVCRFWSLEVPAAPMLTPALAALSVLLARSAVRLEDAARKGAWATFALGLPLVAVCGAFEAAMTHMGLEWLNGREAIAPAWALWPASIGLSLFNAAAGFFFLRPIPERSAATAPATIRPARPAKPEPTDPELAPIIARIEAATAVRRAAN